MQQAMARARDLRTSFMTPNARHREPRTACSFVTQAAVDAGLASTVECQTLLPVKRCSKISRRDMVHSNALRKIDIDQETYNVHMDGQRITVAPARTLSPTQLFYPR